MLRIKKLRIRKINRFGNFSKKDKSHNKANIKIPVITKK